MSDITGSFPGNPSPDNLPEFVPYACTKLQAPFSVRFEIRLQETSFKSQTTMRRSQKKVISTPVVTSMPKTDSLAMRPSFQDDNEREDIVVAAEIDSLDRLVEISIEHCKKVPRMLIQIFALCIPFNPFLNKFTIRCKLPVEALYETVKLLTNSHITEVCLDDSGALERNYYLLLEYQTQLQRLSLARCNITDDDCALLIPKLIYPTPASKTLQTLNLAGNFISDEGARVIGQALRSNRSLLYLNLSGNRVGDDGAACIFRSLIEFPLTAEEIYMKRKRHINLIKLRKEIYAKCLAELMSTQEKEEDISRAYKRRNTNTGLMRRKQAATVSATNVAVKAANMAEEHMDQYPDPFSVQATVCRDNCLYSKGNLTLTYLNLSYNNLGYISIVKLVEVVKYQATAGKQPNFGLMSVQLEGNAVPLCSELDKLSELFLHALRARWILYSGQLTSLHKRIDRSKKSKHYLAQA